MRRVLIRLTIRLKNSQGYILNNYIEQSPREFNFHLARQGKVIPVLN